MGSDRHAQNSILAYDLENGSLIRTYKLDVPVEQIDWESMSIGPCDPQNAKTCMYIGNMGNNKAELCVNTSCTKGFSLGYIYKLEEPDIEYTYHNAPLKVITLEIDLSSTNFPTNRANIESMFVVRMMSYLFLSSSIALHSYLRVIRALWPFLSLTQSWNKSRSQDPVGDQHGGKAGDIYFITKFFNRQDLQRVGKISVEDHQKLSLGSSKKVPVTSVAKISKAGTWTDAAISQDGGLIAVRTTDFVLFYSRSSSQTVADVLGGDACSFVADSYLHLNSAQFESITFSPFPYYAEANECPQGNPCSLHVYKRKLLFNWKMSINLMLFFTLPSWRNLQS